MRRRAGRSRVVEEIRLSAARSLRGPDARGNYSVCCPFCEERVGRVDEEHKLTIKVSGETAPRPGREAVRLSPGHGAWNCYRCEARGYADFTWLGVEEEAPRPAAPEPDLGPPEGFVPLGECERSVSMRSYASYFDARGVLVAARAVGAGACADGRYRGRVVVPLREVRGGPWRGFSARLVGALRGPKYLYPPGMDRRRVLWGAAYADRTAPDPIFIVEGVFDALPLFPLAVATLGKSVTEEQLEALVALRRPLVPCLDGDAWGECRGLAARLRLRGAEVPGWCHLPPGEDPGRLGWGVRQFLQVPA